MNENNIKKTVENLIDTFLDAGRLSLELRKKGLIKEIKSDIIHLMVFILISNIN